MLEMTSSSARGQKPTITLRWLPSVGEAIVLWRVLNALQAAVLAQPHTRNPDPRALEVGVQVSSGTSFDQVGGVILRKQAWVQNPDKDAVAPLLGTIVPRLPQVVASAMRRWPGFVDRRCSPH